MSGFVNLSRRSRVRGAHRGAAASVVHTFHSQTEAFIGQLQTPPTAARAQNYEDLIGGLVDAGLWPFIDMVCLIAAANTDAARRWLTQPTNQFDVINAPTFTADRGYKGNGVNSRLDVGVNINAGLFPQYNVSQNSGCWFCYQIESAQDAGMLSYNSGFSSGIDPRFTDDKVHHRLNGATDGSLTNTDGSGFWASSRTDASNQLLYRNGALFNTSAVASTAIPSQRPVALTDSQVNFSSATISVWGISAGFDARQQMILWKIVLRYLQAVGVV